MRSYLLSIVGGVGVEEPSGQGEQNLQTWKELKRPVWLEGRDQRGGEGAQGGCHSAPWCTQGFGMLP